MKTIPRLCAALGVTMLAHVPLLASAHWPGQPEHQMAQLGDLRLESGEVINNFRGNDQVHTTEADRSGAPTGAFSTN